MIIHLSSQNLAIPITTLTTLRMSKHYYLLYKTMADDLISNEEGFLKSLSREDVLALLD